MSQRSLSACTAPLVEVDLHARAPADQLARLQHRDDNVAAVQAGVEVPVLERAPVGGEVGAVVGRAGRDDLAVAPARAAPALLDEDRHRRSPLAASNAASRPRM
jgi:hypothetical protein